MLGEGEEVDPDELLVGLRFLVFGLWSLVFAFTHSWSSPYDKKKDKL